MIRSWTGTVNTATVRQSETYKLLNSLVTKTIKSQLLSTVDATLPNELLVYYLNMTTPQKLSNVLPLRLLAQGLVELSNLQHPSNELLVYPESYVFQFKYSGSDFQNVKVTPVPFEKSTTTDPQKVIYANAVYAAYSVQGLIKRIDNSIHSLQQYLPSKPIDWVLEIESTLAKTLNRLCKEYLPQTYTNLVQRYSELLQDLNLSNVFEVLPQLSDLLNNVFDAIRRFSTVQVSLDILFEFQRATNDDMDAWINCLNNLLEVKYAKAGTEDIIDDVLYDYMVGYSLTSQLCELLGRNWLFQAQRFGSMLDRLMTATNVPDHKTFFQTLKTNLTDLCKDQADLELSVIDYFGGVDEVECTTRMEKSKDIIKEISRLYQFLRSGSVPEPGDYFYLDVAFSDAEVFLDTLAAMEIVYLSAFSNAPTSFIASARNTIAQHIRANPIKYGAFFTTLVLTPAIAAAVDPATLHLLVSTSVDSLSTKIPMFAKWFVESRWAVAPYIPSIPSFESLAFGGRVLGQLVQSIDPSLVTDSFPVEATKALAGWGYNVLSDLVSTASQYASTYAPTMPFEPIY